MKNGKHAVDLCLDSGAFSAWSRNNEELNLKKYIKYIKRNETYLDSYVNMDNIPGIFGEPRTQEQLQYSAESSYRNLQIMKDAGLNPIAAFHQGEPIQYLERMLKDGQERIGLSIIKTLQLRFQFNWFDDVFSTLTDSKGRPTAKLHGFGLVSPSMLFRYPWYSVDSTTWSMTPGYGRIIVPPMIDGKLAYNAKPMRIVVSGVPSQHGQDKALMALGPLQQRAVLTFFDEIGISIQEARYSTSSRRRSVLMYYIKLAEHLTKVRFRTRKKTRGLPFTFDAAAVPFEGVNVMFATHPTNHEWSWLLNDCGARSRLMSYYIMMNKSDDELQQYVETGRLQDYVPNQRPKNSKSVHNHSEAVKNYMRLQVWERLKYYEQREEDNGASRTIGAVGDRGTSTVGQ